MHHDELWAQLGGVVFGGNDDGPVIEPDGLTGWRGRPGSSGRSEQRLDAHGESDSTVYMGGRVITIRGWVGGDPARWDEWMDRLSGLGADGERMRLVVGKGDRSTWAWVRVIEPQVEQASSRENPEFLITLRAANPRRFGETHEVPTSPNVPVEFVNQGNFRAAPVFVVNGPQPTGYSLVAPGQGNFQVLPLPAGSQDVIDFASGDVIRNGAVLAGAAVLSNIWTVPATGSQRWQTAPTGSGSIVGYLTDTYV